MMKIIEIKPGRAKFVLTFDNGGKLAVSKRVFEKFPYSLGSEISDAELKNLINQDEIFLIKASALRIISRREHSVKELKDKLLRKGYSEKNIDSVLEILIRDNFLNDERFTELYVRQNFELKKRSPKVIRYNLSKLGIDNSLVDKYLSEIDEDKIFENALDLAIKKLKSVSKKSKEKQLFAVRNFLLYRAFPNDVINKTLTEIKERLGA